MAKQLTLFGSEKRGTAARLYCEDCITGMAAIESGSVDAVITDPPYGITDNEWDVAPPLEEMWRQFWRVLKPNGVVAIFGQEPFASRLRLSSGHFRYDWIWRKNLAAGFLNAKKMPLRAHETITIHYRRLPVYNPQWTYSYPYTVDHGGCATPNYGKVSTRPVTVSDGRRYPVDVIQVRQEVLKFAGRGGKRTLHPTQKPVELMEYLVKTYTNEGDTVLDPYMGSGTTGVACASLGRHFIGYEMSSDYYEIARQRIDDTA